MKFHTGEGKEDRFKYYLLNWNYFEMNIYAR